MKCACSGVRIFPCVIQALLISWAWSSVLLHWRKVIKILYFQSVESILVWWRETLSFLSPNINFFSLNKNSLLELPISKVLHPKLLCVSGFKLLRTWTVLLPSSSSVIRVFGQARLSSTSEFWVSSDQDFTEIGAIKQILTEQVSLVGFFKF